MPRRSSSTLPCPRGSLPGGALTLAILLAAPLSGQAVGGPVGAADSLAFGDSVRLEAVISAAVLRNPGLQAQRALAEASRRRAPAAGTLPDPVLQVGAMNLSLPELDNDMPASMLPTVQLTQTFPFFGKLGLRREVADREGEAAELDVMEAEWDLRTRVADHFYALYFLDRSLEVHGRTLDLLEDFQSVARALYSSGTARQGDVIRADVEVARMDAEIRRIEAVREARAAQLNGLLDRPGPGPVPPAALPDLPEEIPAMDTLLAWAMEARPALRRERVAREGARQGVELARKDFWPDFTVAAQYGRGGPDARNMGGLMIGASLPVHTGSRQRPRLEAARAMERHADARIASVRASVEAELRTVLAELERARSLMALYRDEILPTARVNVSSSLASYRVDAVDFATLVDAQLALDQFEEEYHQLVSDYGAAVSRLEAAMGRSLPTAESLPIDVFPDLPE